MAEAIARMATQALLNSVRVPGTTAECGAEQFPPGTGLGDPAVLASATPRA
ncbi:hypothetical protein SGLAM104S_08049 [Streptomyces glaucescens]